MQFSIIATIVLATAASAADIIGWSGRNCNGNTFSCRGIQENICCNFGRQVNSIAWTLPANSRGVGYTGARCGPQAQSPVFGQVTRFCRNYAVRSGKWFVGTGRKTRRGVIGARGGDTEEDCEKPNVYSYHYEGKVVHKKIPKEKYTEVSKWVEDDDYEKLSKLEDYEVDDE